MVAHTLNFNTQEAEANGGQGQTDLPRVPVYSQSYKERNLSFKKNVYDCLHDS